MRIILLSLSLSLNHSLSQRRHLTNLLSFLLLIFINVMEVDVLSGQRLRNYGFALFFLFKFFLFSFFLFTFFFLFFGSYVFKFYSGSYNRTYLTALRQPEKDLPLQPTAFKHRLPIAGSRVAFKHQHSNFGFPCTSARSNIGHG